MKNRIILLACLLMFAAIYQPIVRAQQEKTVVASQRVLNNPSSISINPPASCVVSFLADYVKWLQQTPTGKTNIVRVAAASNQPNRLVTYAEGTLALNTGAFPPGPGQIWALTGTLTQYFSDRKYGLPSSGGGISLAQYPFSPNKTDQLGLDTDVTGGIKLTLKSYNNTVINLTGVSCSAGVLYGLTNTSPLQSFYVISLSKDSVSNAQPK